MKSIVLMYAEVHVVITNPDGLYLWNTGICGYDLSWQVIYTEHKEYVAVCIVMTCLGSYMESVSKDSC